MSYPNPGSPGPSNPDPQYGQPGAGSPHPPQQYPPQQYGQGYPPPGEQYPPQQYGQAAVPPQHAPPGEGPQFTPPPAPRRKGRVLRIVLLVLVGLLVLCGVGGYLIARPYLAQYPATMSTPETVAGLPKANQPELQALVDQMKTQVSNEVEMDEVVAAFYQNPQEPEKLVMLLGGTKLFLSPESELDAGFRSASTGGVQIRDVQDVEPGELGGHARCGLATTEGVDMSVCAWADHGSFAMLMFFNRTIAESQQLMRQIRSEVLTR